MTTATTVENNSTNHDQINKVKFNQTANSDKETQTVVNNTLQSQNNHCSNNTNNNATDCETITTTENENTNKTEENQVVDKNTVLKYVYKKGDKAEIPIKDKGHFKNSLRRKRSTSELHDKSPLPSKYQKPVIVNYETVHGSGEVLTPLRNTGNNILGANLADFNIETLHLNPDAKTDENLVPNLKKDSSETESLNEGSNERGDKQKYDNNSSTSESDESGERGEYKNEKPQQGSESSEERGNYRNRKPSRDDQDSTERSDYKTSKSVNDSGEREDYQNKKSSRENDDSSEQVDYKNIDSSQDRGESGESDAYKNSESSRRHEDSSERGDYKSKRNGSGDTYNSAEIHENNPRANSRYSTLKKTSKESSSSETRKPDPNSSESKESIETDDRDGKKTHGIQERRKYPEYLEDDSSYDAPLLLDSKHKNIEKFPRKNVDSSNESSDEGNKNIERRKPQQNYKLDPNIKITKSSSVPLRNIDLGDFNYERVHVNNDGKVVTQKDNLEYADPKTAVEILPLSTAIPVAELKNHGTINFLPDVNTLASPQLERNGNKLIHIDDGEVKPVVEINPESEPNVSEEVESLESILGVKQPENFDDNDQNDKIVEQTEVQNGDVKQEFERIPVNYNHAKKTENKDSPATEVPKKDTEVKQRDGTLDVFAPEDVKYDENLNIKFDELAIKLPEIKLPDDILAFSKDSSPYSYDDDKKQTQPDVPSYKPSYDYDHDDKEKTRKDKNDDDDSGDDDDSAPDTGYYGYYDDNDKNQNYKKKKPEADSDEEEDLYEKFVRERFGKQGTFEKRSEKLQAVAPNNPELYKTIKNILKKTADIDEQAQKSGDPNAAYMWTLEYGEKL